MRPKRGWLALLAGAALPAMLGLPATAYANCAEALGLLQAQVRLIEEAAPLAADREASLQPARTLSHKIAPALSERTMLAGSGLAGEASRPSNKAVYDKAVADANAAVARARAALAEGDEAACQEAVSDGLNAADQARLAL